MKNKFLMTLMMTATVPMAWAASPLENLCEGASSGKLTLVKNALLAGAPVDGPCSPTSDHVEVTPFFIAANGRRWEIANFLTQSGSNPAAESRFRYSKRRRMSNLQVAISHSNLQSVESYLAYPGMDVNHFTYGASPLAWAIELSSPEREAIIQALLDQGADIYATMQKVTRSSTATVNSALAQALVRADSAGFDGWADVQRWKMMWDFSQDKMGVQSMLNLALSHAQGHGSELVKWLVTKGAKLDNIPVEVGGVQIGFTSALNLMYQKENLTRVDADLQNYLMAHVDAAGPSKYALAMATRVPGAIDALLAKGFDPNAAYPLGVSDYPQYFSETPLMRVQNVRDAQSLIAAGARVDARDENGNTVLMHALYHQNFEVAGFLLEHGSQASEKNHSKLTAYCLAYRHAQITGFQDGNLAQLVRKMHRQGGSLGECTADYQKPRLSW